jgi:hypothetical protein
VQWPLLAAREFEFTRPTLRRGKRDREPMHGKLPP